ncbi:MAG: hypothetical protein J6S43_05820 [Lentisphaeria bacterium]|nr:hypothetical protein [Lentisphaeria bacterium]
MPELPEAENIGRALKRTICGETITKVEVFTPAMRTSLLPLAEADLPGHRIVDVRFPAIPFLVKYHRFLKLQVLIG